MKTPNTIALLLIFIVTFFSSCEPWDLEKLDVTCPKIINLSGNLAFGNVEVPATTPPTLVLRIANSGTCPLTILSIETPAGYSDNLNASTSIASNQFIDVEIEFNPSQVGPFQGSISVNSDATSGVNTIVVSGAGIDASVGGSGILSAPGAIDFGSIQLNNSASKILTLSNTGDAPLTVNNIESSSSIFSSDFSTPFNIGANSNKQITVIMNTSAIGVFAGEISIFSNVNNKVVSVAGKVINAGSGGCDAQFTDDRDGQMYHATMFNNECWMTENLRYNTQNAGDDLPYQGDDAYLDAFGRYYTWSVVMNGATSSASNPSGVQGLCPNGWHLPSKSEYESLISYYGGDEHLTYLGIIEGGDSGLDFVLAGKWSSSLGWFANGSNGYYWTTTESLSSNAYSAGFNVFMIQEDFGMKSESKSQRMPCRCIKD